MGSKVSRTIKISMLMLGSAALVLGAAGCGDSAPSDGIRPLPRGAASSPPHRHGEGGTAAAPASPATGQK